MLCAGRRGAASVLKLHALAETPDGRPMNKRHTADKKYWHPYLGVSPLESTDFPAVVVPVPRPIYSKVRRENRMRKADYVFEHGAL